jgi:hypothetical protein
MNLQFIESQLPSFHIVQLKFVLPVEFPFEYHFLECRKVQAIIIIH